MLQENPAPALQQLAERLGYKSAQTLRIRCPELYFALVERAYLKEYKEAIETQLKAVLTEAPPPPLRAVARRLGLKNEGRIYYHFPDLAQAITDRRRNYLQTVREQVKTALETALTQVPPPSIRQVARNTRQSLTNLNRLYPDLCRQVAAHRIKYLHERAVKNREKRKAVIKQVVLSLIAQGIYPSKGRIQQAASNRSILRANWAHKYYDELMSEIKILG